MTDAWEQRAQKYGLNRRGVMQKRYPNFILNSLERWQNEQTKCLCGTVLDIGCGYGRLSLPIKERGHKPTGVDISATHVKNYEERTECPAKMGTAEKLPFENETFDCALMATTLRYCEDENLAVGEAWRILKTGGALLIIEGNKRVEKWLLLNFAKHATAGHSFDRMHVENVLLKNGFRVSRDHVNSPWFGIQFAVRGVKK